MSPTAHPAIASWLTLQKSTHSERISLVLSPSADEECIETVLTALVRTLAVTRAPYAANGFCTSRRDLCAVGADLIIPIPPTTRESPPSQAMMTGWKILIRCLNETMSKEASVAAKVAMTIGINT